MRHRLALLAFLVPFAASAATLRWANDGDISALDPYTRNETFQNSFLANIYEGLVRRDADLNLQPALAVRWEQADPLTWRFHLRPGVRWQDGSPFTADDVVFSARRVRTETSLQRSVFATVAEVRALDPLTVEFRTARPDPILDREIANWLVMSRAWCEAHGSEQPVRVGTGGAENYAVRNAMGTGPFRLVLREPDRRTVLERNPDWWDTPQHNLDRVEFTVIANAATRVSALVAGDMDMIESVPIQDLDRLAHAPGVHLYTKPELRTIFLGLDQWRDELLTGDVKGRNPFKDRRVREALLLAIDEDAIASRIMRGQAHPTFLMWGPGVNGYDPALDHRPAADPARAKALLAEAGYPEGFSVRLDCPNDRYVNDAAICTAIVSMLARVGVRVELAARTKALHFAQINPPDNKTDFYMLGWTPGTYDAENVLFTLLGTPSGEGRGADNDGRYSNPRVDALVEQIALETDQAKRLALIREAARIVQEDVAYIPLHQQALAWAARGGVQLVQMADGYFPLWLVRKQ